MQALEVVVALVFVDLSVHVSHAGLMIGAAAVFAALAVTAQGPLGLFRICSQRIHLLLVVIAAAAVAVAPVIPALRPDIQGIIIIEFGAVGLIRLATLTLATDYPPTGIGAGRHRRITVTDATVIDTTATVANGQASAPRPTPPPDRSTNTPNSTTSTTKGSAARWVGRTTGTAATTGKKMAAKYGPEAEQQVKRTIRGAGRLAGRVTSSPKPPDDPTG